MCGRSWSRSIGNGIAFGWVKPMIETYQMAQSRIDEVVSIRLAEQGVADDAIAKEIDHRSSAGPGRPRLCGMGMRHPAAMGPRIWRQPHFLQNSSSKRRRNPLGGEPRDRCLERG